MALSDDLKAAQETLSDLWNSADELYDTAAMHSIDDSDLHYMEIRHSIEDAQECIDLALKVADQMD